MANDLSSLVSQSLSKSLTPSQSPLNKCDWEWMGGGVEFSAAGSLAADIPVSLGGCKEQEGQLSVNPRLRYRLG